MPEGRTLMPEVCPSTVEIADGIQCQRNSGVTESNFAGLFKTQMCIYQCGNGVFVLRWQHRFLFFKSEIKQKIILELQ